MAPFANADRPRGPFAGISAAAARDRGANGPLQPAVPAAVPGHRPHPDSTLHIYAACVGRAQPSGVVFAGVSGSSSHPSCKVQPRMLLGPRRLMPGCAGGPQCDT